MLNDFTWTVKKKGSRNYAPLCTIIVFFRSPLAILPKQTMNPNPETIAVQARANTVFCTIS